MAITIVEQTEKHGKEEVPVLCKRIGFIPNDTGEGMSFIPLNFILLQIIVKDTRGTEYKIKWNNKSGMPGRINLHFPDEMTLPTFYTGRGKSRRQHFDYLAKPIVKKGAKFGYNDMSELLSDNKWLNPLAEQITTLFIQKIGECASVRK